MEGLHLTADCFDCQCDLTLFSDESRLTELVKLHTNAAGLTIVGEKFHAFRFPDGRAAGITGTLLLAESHVAIHTWPERAAVTLDVYVCNFENDNSDKARHIVKALLAAFLPRRHSQQEIIRGLSSTNNNAIEHLTPHTKMLTQVDRIIASVQSPFQHIEIASTPEFGKIMRIDGAMMTSEKDEHFYHESLVHPAAIMHGNPQNALIIGGGDGGSTEELLKYQSIQNITLCEIDEQVIALAREHLSAIHQNAFDSPRVRIKHTDGFVFIQNDNHHYDLILLDLTDPIAPNGNNLAQSCMNQEFFQTCYERLTAGGFLVLHLGSEFYHPQRHHSTLAKLASVFDAIRPYAVFIPLYGALWGMAMAQKKAMTKAVEQHVELNVHELNAHELDAHKLDAQEIQNRIESCGINDLKFYSGTTHIQLFAETLSKKT